MLVVVAVRGSSSSYTANTSRRERNLDHWDAETLAAYLGLDPITGKPLPEKDTYVGNDAAVMFYAQWCKNCHSFAPLWDTIATLLHAGTTDSNLIMALFNCELDQQHMTLCKAAGVTHYPTLLFIGDGEYRTGNKLAEKLSSFSSKKKVTSVTLPRTVKYNGPLGIGEAVMDWIRTMQGLSTWHKWSQKGWIHWLRSKLLIPGFLRTGSNSNTASNGKEKAMPVGIPYLSVGNQKQSDPASVSVTNSALQSKVKSMESKVSKLETKNSDLQQTTEHAGSIIDSFLFPPGTDSVSDDGNKYAHTDIFALMTETKAWDVKTAEFSIDANADADAQKGAVLKSCFVDMALDYCTRASTKFTNEYLTKLDEQTKGENATEYPSFGEMEKQMKQILLDEEPYCSIVSKCYKEDFTSSECRPDTCPFVNDSGCRYVSSSCLAPSIQKEYFKALTEESKKKEQDQKSNEDEATTGGKAPAGAWGV